MNFKNRPHSSRTDRLLLLAFVGCFLAAHLIVGAMDQVEMRSIEEKITDDVLDESKIYVGDLVMHGEPPPAILLPPGNDGPLIAEYLAPEIPLGLELQTALREACEEYGIPLCLALGLIEVESNFDPDADNGVSVGLIQTNAKYASTFEGNAGYSIYSPSGNIHCGVWYLSSLISRYNGDQLAALTAYNRGTYSGTVSQYARSVMKASEKWGAG